VSLICKFEFICHTVIRETEFNNQQVQQGDVQYQKQKESDREPYMMDV